MNRMAQNRTSRSGFTLVELVIAILIISVLANIAISRIQDYTAKAKCTEAVVGLGSYERFQSTFYDMNDRVGTLPEIGLEVPDGGWFTFSQQMNSSVAWSYGGNGAIQTAASSKSNGNGNGNGNSGSTDTTGSSSKVTVCHTPPGNPANAHSITVGNPAWAAHVAHGDPAGACESGDTTETATLVATSRTQIIWDCKSGNAVFTEWSAGEATRGNLNGGNCGKYMGSWFKR